MTVGERLRQILNIKNVTPYKMGQEIPITRAMIGNYISGENEPSVKNIILIAEYLDANINWLLTGKGEMFNNEEEIRKDYSPEENPTENLNVNESPTIYGLDNDISITDPKFKEHSLLNSINNMSQAMIISANTGERNSKNMEKLIDLLTKKIEESDKPDTLK